MIRYVLRAALLENLGLKALAMVLAAGLFVFVRAGRAVETTVALDVTYTLPRERVLLSPLASHVRVTLRGPWARVARLTPHDLKSPVRVDLSAEPSGEYHFRPDLLAPPHGVQIASVTPASMRLDFDPLIERPIPVEVSFDGEPQPGWEASHVEATPLAVPVRGAQRVVGVLQHLFTVPVSLQNRSESFSTTVALRPLPEHARFAGLRTVKVEVTMRPRVLPP